jgi:DNA-binding NarL/FixJ family response regulator
MADLHVAASTRPRCAGPRRPQAGSAWITRAACGGRSALFDNASRTAEATKLCARCPVLRDCRRWALVNAVDGFAGGMTVEARAAWRRSRGVREPQVTFEDVMPLFVVSADRRWGRGRSEAILGAVAEWTAKGATAREIAAELGVTRRTVCRLRARCRQRDAADGTEAAIA